MMRLKHMTLVCAAALVCMTGCNGTADISKFSQSALAVNRDGSITELSVEPFEAEYYSLEDLDAYVREEAADYNADHPAASGKEDDLAITVDSVEVSDAVARVLLTYESPETYTDFNYNSLVVCPASQLSEDVLALSCVNAGGEAVGTAADIEDLQGYNAVVVSSDVMVAVPGKIAYVSDNVTVTDKAVADCSGALAVIIYS